MAENAHNEDIVGIFIRDRFKTLEASIGKVEDNTTKILTCVSGIESWKVSHDKSHAKDDKVTKDRLNNHSDELKMNAKFRNRFWGAVTGIPLIVSVILGVVTLILRHFFWS